MDKLNKKALSAGILFTICQFFTRGISFLVTPFYTRVLSVEQFGVVKIFESWILILVPIVTLSVFKSVEVAKHDYESNYNNYVGNIVILGGILCFSFGIVSIIFRDIVCKILGIETWMLYILIVSIFGELSIMCFNRREKQLFRSKTLVIFTTIIVVVSTMFSVLLLLYGKSKGQTDQLLMYRIGGYYIPRTMLEVTLAFVLIMQGKKQPNTKGQWKYALRFSIPLIMELVSIQIMNQIDKIMISKMKGNAEAAIYSLATTVSYIIWILEDSVWSAWQPWLYEKISRGEEKDVQQYWDKMMYIFGFITMGIVLVSPEIILILGGKRYMAAIYVVMPLVISTLYRFYSFSFSAMENYYKKTKYVALATIISMVLNVIFNYVGILMFGYIAAAYATALSYFILMLIQAIFEIKTTGSIIISLKKTVLVSVVLFIICCGLVTILKFNFVIRWAILFVAAAVYLFINRDMIKSIYNGYVNK